MLTLLALLVQPPADFKANRRSLTEKERILFSQDFADRRVPRRQDVLAAEPVLARFPCVGPMRHWYRIFSFGRNAKTFRIDTTLIGFLLIEAGHNGRPAGRHITTLLGGLGGGPDNGHFRFVTGVYSIRTHLTTVTFCGQNHPEDG